MNNNNSFLFGIFDFMELAHLPVVDDVTFVGSIWINTTQNIHKCGFTRTILSYQCVDFSLFNLQIYIV